MNKETYEALKNIMAFTWKNLPTLQAREDYSKVQNWIDEVAKDYQTQDEGESIINDH